MHLTNYSVNKHNKNFERHDGADRGSKRSILSFLSYLKSVGCNTGLLWRQITVSVCLNLLKQAHWSNLIVFLKKLAYKSNGLKLLVNL